MMPESSKISWYGMTDSLIVTEIGKQLKQTRLNRNLTQERLAQLSGLDRSTISQLENGRAATLLTLVQVLRALERLDLLDHFVAEKIISPILALKLQGKKRKRASAGKSNGDLE